VSDDGFQRTEPATPHRREQARREGQVAQSREVQSVALLIAALLGLSSGVGLALRDASFQIAREAWTLAGRPPESIADGHALLIRHGGVAALALLPMLGLLALAGVAASLAQTGPFFSLAVVRFRATRLDPLAGLRRLASVERLFELAKSLAKVGFLVGIAWWVVQGKVPGLVDLMRLPVAASTDATVREAARLAAALLVALAPLAALDYAWQRHRHEKRLRMTKQEVREEARQREGDPQLRARSRARHRELSRSRMIAAVARADVVVTNPTHFAVALRYDVACAAAPEVLAKGRDRVAARIREEAVRHGVPIVEDAPLARLLHRTCEIGRQIPENLFQAVAEVLAYVYRLDPARARRWRNGS